MGKSREERTTITDPVLKLARCFIRARHMHALVHDMVEGIGVDQLENEGAALEFQTYLEYWLAGLFVVVEGFNKLRLEDPSIRRLLRLHTKDLKEFRDETYHFFPGPPRGIDVVGALNWVEELHEAFQAFFEREFPAVAESMEASRIEIRVRGRMGAKARRVQKAKRKASPAGD